MDTPVQQVSWWRRNWKWAVPVGCLGLLVILAGAGVGIFWLVMSFIKSSDVYVEALGRAQNNPQVIQALGTPITGKFFCSGSINVSGASGNADLSIPIAGPKGEATIYVVAIKSEGKWEYQKMKVVVVNPAASIDLIKH